jgi:3',5'-cyclic AMP phosphodiesterase CpdA
MIQISDPHFGTERLHVQAALTKFVRECAPSLVILSGDITQRARRREFAAALEFMHGLNAPRFLAIPGNHDIPLFNPLLRLWFPYRNYSRAFGDELEPEHESASQLVLCVNTTRRYRHKDGEVSRRQVERVAQRLQRALREQLRVVVVHQPVHVITKSDLTNLLHGHESAVRAWAAAGADIVLGGHIHLPYVRPLSECFPDLPRKVWAVQAGTAVSERVRGGIPNSVNVLRHESSAPLSCTVERWDHDLQSGAFARVEARTLALDRDASGRT